MQKINDLKKVLNKRLKKVKKEDLTKIRRAGILVVVAAVLYFSRSLFVAAVVDGVPITRLSLLRQLESTYGQEQLDNLITQQLILREAKAQGVTVTDAEVEDQINEIRDILSDQGVTLEEALNLQGQSMKDLESNVRIQKSVDKLLGSQVQVTDEDVLGFYDENKDLYYPETELDQVKDQIKDQLYQQKIGEEYTNWISELRANAKIDYVVEF